ncbi:NAD-dependent epimerase/dehydratase family protein [Arthrobacter sp. JZ12]|uniref:NAD-dependent epimerase/dehydratase family protein n=1 Tax=Arthrobacter sp. JZ12 TaxID=2654190 RepID=UPI002B47026B|nr:NAD-dependent epimerase/dehydratase family protein [Arthrobacter sp. JZ12]WRH25129.1 NAD-dependent epimerase/dehydratase family protein [Arthrobacter sp. JZ12]
MKVLVTGASGMLGGAVAALMVGRSYSVRTFQRRGSRVAGAQDVFGDLTDPAAVEQAVAGVDGIIHLAAKVSFSGEENEFHRVNVLGTASLLEAARAAGAQRFIYVSSPSVAHVGRSLAGAGAEPADPHGARGAYARTKAQAERLALTADDGRMAVAAIRPHVVWGPGDTQLVERVIARAHAGRLPLLSGGTAMVDTTYVDNAASAIAAAYERIEHIRGLALVVTNGEPRPIGELLARICAAGGAPEPRWSIPGWLGRAAGSVVETLWRRSTADGEPPMTRFLAEQLSTAHWFDQRRTRELLNWTPEVGLDEGFKRLAAHYGNTR